MQIYTKLRGNLKKEIVCTFDCNHTDKNPWLAAVIWSYLLSSMAPSKSTVKSELSHISWPYHPLQESTLPSMSSVSRERLGQRSNLWPPFHQWMIMVKSFLSPKDWWIEEFGVEVTNPWHRCSSSGWDYLRKRTLERCCGRCANSTPTLWTKCSKWGRMLGFPK